MSALAELGDIEDVISDYYHQDFSGVHRAANLFPMPTEDEFEVLCRDLETMGLVHPLIRDEKTQLLLDGRSRLMAAFATNNEIRVVDVDMDDPIAYSISLNMARRSLSAPQKAFVANGARAMYDAEAKGRQGTRTDLNIVTPVSQSKPAPKARDQAAAATGAGVQYTDMAKNITDHAPELVEAAKNGEVTMKEANREATKRKKAANTLADSEQSANKPATKKEQVNIITTDGKTAATDKPKRPVFNVTNDSVSWAKYTWNPVTGCNHGCNFCYAREIAHNKRMAPFYPFKFEPSFHEYRLPAPVNTKRPKSDNPIDGRVFVCSMADLFGKWVPDEWIEKVFGACMAAPEWEYLFLTKWPKRYKLLERLPHAWFGASIIQQVDVARVERDMDSFDTDGVKWISLEPMLEPITFNDLSWCDLVVIGAQTSTVQPGGVRVPERAVPFDWVVDVVNQCRAEGVPYYLKPNLATAPGMDMPHPEPSIREETA